MSASDPSDGPSLATRVNHEWSRLSKTERVVARYLAASPPQEIMLATAGELGRRTGTSDATVVRTARRLGYQGLPDLKSALGTRLGAQAPPQISSRLDFSESARDQVSAVSSGVVRDAVSRVSAFARAVDPTDLGKAVQVVASASEVLCYGWGTNELSARYLSLKLNRIGVSARASGATGYTLADDLLGISARHAIVMFAPGRVLPDLRLLVAHGKASGAGLVLVTENVEQDLQDEMDVVLRDEGSPGGLTAEPMCALLLADMLVLSMMAVMKEPATATYDLLTRLRTEIVGEI